MEELTEGGRVGLQKRMKAKDAAWLLMQTVLFKSIMLFKSLPVPHLNDKGVWLASTMFLVFQAIYMGLEEKIQKHTQSIQRVILVRSSH